MYVQLYIYTQRKEDEITSFVTYTKKKKKLYTFVQKTTKSSHAWDTHDLDLFVKRNYNAMVETRE